MIDVARMNPLHIDDAFGARTPFGRRVVHGLFIGALVSTAHTNLTGMLLEQP